MPEPLYSKHDLPHPQGRELETNYQKDTYNLQHSCLYVQLYAGSGVVEINAKNAGGCMLIWLLLSTEEVKGAVKRLTMNLWYRRGARRRRKGNVRNALCRLVKSGHEASVTPTEPFCGLPHPEFRYSRR